VSARVRSTGEILCAAMHPEEPGDIYIDDGLHYTLGVVLRLLVTEPMHLPEGQGLGGHAAHGRWWWRGHAPTAANVDPFYA